MGELDEDFEEVMEGNIYNELEEEDLEEQQSMSEWGGLKLRKAPNKKRDFAKAYKKVVAQYFSGADFILTRGLWARFPNVKVYI